MNYEMYNIQSYWGPRQTDIESYSDTFCQFANELSKINTIFTEWSNPGKSSKLIFNIPIEKNDFLPVAEKARFCYDVPAGKIWNSQGFWIYAVNCGGHHGRGEISPLCITNVHVGRYIDEKLKHNSNEIGVEYYNSIDIRLGNIEITTRRPWLASQLLPVLKLILHIWRPRQLSVDCNRHPHPMIADSSWASGERWLHPWAGWLTYLSPALYPKIALPKGVIVEKLDFGGAIVALCEEPFTIDDPVHMARMAAMEAAMRPFQT